MLLFLPKYLGNHDPPLLRRAVRERIARELRWFLRWLILPIVNCNSWRDDNPRKSMRLCAASRQQRRAV